MKCAALLPPCLLKQEIQESKDCFWFAWWKSSSSYIPNTINWNLPTHPALFSLFLSAAPSLISELRAEKIEQKSITLVWRQPSYPNSSRTEYEVKYYEKVNPPLHQTPHHVLFSLNKSSKYNIQSSFFFYFVTSSSVHEIQFTFIYLFFLLLHLKLVGYQKLVDVSLCWLTRLEYGPFLSCWNMPPKGLLKF